MVISGLVIVSYFRPREGEFDEDPFWGRGGRVCRGCRDQDRTRAEARESARIDGHAVADRRGRPAPEVGRGHWAVSVAGPTGITRLLCVFHTCGITRTHIPDHFFYNFFGAADAESGLERRDETILTLGLNIWISIPEFGPRNYVCWLPVSWSFELRGRLRAVLGSWVAVHGGLEVQIVDLRREPPERVCTQVTRRSLRAWCRMRTREVGAMILSRGSSRVRVGEVVPVVYCYPEPRSDVSVVAVNLFVSRFLPILGSDSGSGREEPDFPNHDWGQFD